MNISQIFKMTTQPPDKTAKRPSVSNVSDSIGYFQIAEGGD